MAEVPTCCSQCGSDLAWVAKVCESMIYAKEWAARHNALVPVMAEEWKAVTVRGYHVSRPPRVGREPEGRTMRQQLWAAWHRDERDWYAACFIAICNEHEFSDAGANPYALEDLRYTIHEESWCGNPDI